MVDQKNFHDFITAEILNLSTIQPYEEWILNFDNEDLGITNADTEHGIDIEVETFEPIEVDTGNQLQQTITGRIYGQIVGIYLNIVSHSLFLHM